MNYHSLPSDSNIPLHCCYKDLAIISFPSTFFLYAIVIMFYLFICYKHYITLLILLYIIYYLLNRFFLTFPKFFIWNINLHLGDSLGVWTCEHCVYVSGKERVENHILKMTLCSRYPHNHWEQLQCSLMVPPWGGRRLTGLHVICLRNFLPLPIVTEMVC